MLRQGKVIERGTHDDLMAETGGFYAQLQALQDGASSSLAATPAVGDVPNLPCPTSPR